jgi:hypothetical protein
MTSLKLIATVALYIIAMVPLLHLPQAVCTVHMPLLHFPQAAFTVHMRLCRKVV